MEPTTTTTIDPSTLDQTALQSLLGGSGGTTPSLIPESLIASLTFGLIALSVLSGLFFLFYIINMIRKWKVDSAILNMRKDLAEIKMQLSNHPAQPVPQQVSNPEPLQPQPTEPAPEPVAQPAEQNRTVAQESTDDTRLPS